MSFKKFIEETQNFDNFSKEQKFVLYIGREMENLDYKLKPIDANTTENYFKDFFNQESRFSFYFTNKDNKEVNLQIQNKKDGKYSVSLCLENRSVSEEIKIDNYFRENDPSLINSYIKERIKNIESNPLLFKPPQRDFLQNNNKIYYNKNNDYINANNNDFYRNNNFERNFGNIGYNDLHGDLPVFGAGFNDPLRVPRGNLMGREAFGYGGFGGPGGVRYDPITPFGPGFDIIPPHDRMKKFDEDPLRGVTYGMPGNNLNNNFQFGGNSGFGSVGSYNPFI